MYKCSVCIPASCKICWTYFSHHTTYQVYIYTLIMTRSVTQLSLSQISFLHRSIIGVLPYCVHLCYVSFYLYTWIHSAGNTMSTPLGYYLDTSSSFPYSSSMYAFMYHVNNDTVWCAVIGKMHTISLSIFVEACTR